VKTVGLPPEHPTIASLLKGNGYDTALVGKWHLGYLPEYGPNRHGFNEFFGILSGAGDFFTHKDAAGTPDLYEDLVPVERVGYMTDLLTERAIKYITRPRKRPFYLSLHYTAPHWPWEGPGDEQVSRTLKRGYAGFTAGGSLKVYASMMKSLDDGVGRVMKALRVAQLDRNTLVIFTSDNGGERFSYNCPFTGAKFDLREGGIRVPAMVRWPGVVPAGRTTDQVAVTMDWTATILATTQTKPDPNYLLDGDDLLSTIRGMRPVYDRTLFWRTRRQDAALYGRWKYLREGKYEYLFDLSRDEREQADFKAENADTFQRLRAEFQKWKSQVLPYPTSTDGAGG
jgi:arylsulfatase A-like enzyme